MKRTIIIIFLVLFIILAICRLLLPQRSTVERLKNLKSYSCNIELRVINKVETLKYHLVEYYCSGIGYRIELGKERVFIFKNDKIYVEDVYLGKKYILKGTFDTVFKYTFICNQLKTCFSKAQFSREEGSDYLKAVADLPDNNRNLKWAEVFIEAKTARPKYLYIYNWKNIKTIEMEYLTFEANKVDKISAEALMNTDSWPETDQQ